MTARTVLLTGATGFLGGALAAELLGSQPDVRPLFLVRAADACAALQRLCRSIERFEPGLGACVPKTWFFAGASIPSARSLTIAWPTSLT